jgi:hypothetical protein
MLKQFPFRIYGRRKQQLFLMSKIDSSSNSQTGICGKLALQENCRVKGPRFLQPDQFFQIFLRFRKFALPVNFVDGNDESALSALIGSQEFRQSFSTV